MPIVPAGVFSQAIERLGDTIAQSATWLSLHGGDATQARARLARVGSDVPHAWLDASNDIVVYPRGIIGQGKGLSYVRNSTSGWGIEGPLQVLWDFPRTAAAADDNDEIIEFANSVGLICEEVAALVAQMPAIADVLHSIKRITPDSSRRTSDSWQWFKATYRFPGHVPDTEIVDLIRGFSAFEIGGSLF